MSRRYRSRPIDVRKPLQIFVDGLPDGAEDMQVQRSVSVKPTGTDSAGASMEAKLNRSTKPIPKPEAKIWVPEIRDVPGYDKTPEDFERPAAYIKKKTMIDLIGYDVDAADEAWMADFNHTHKSEGEPLTWDSMGTIIDQLEKGTFRRGEDTQNALLPFSIAERIVHIKGISKVQVAGVYDYWKQKRDKWGKALIINLRPPPDPNDRDPGRPFRSRESSRKRTRRNDRVSQERMHMLRKDFDRVRDLLAIVQRREKVKRELLHSYIRELALERHNLLVHHDPALRTSHFVELTERYFSVSDWRAQQVRANARWDDLLPLPMHQRAQMGGKDKFASTLVDATAHAVATSTTTTTHTSTPTSPPRASRASLSVRERRKRLLGRRPSRGRQRVLRVDALPAVPVRSRGRVRIGRGGRVIFDRRLEPLHVEEGVGTDEDESEEDEESEQAERRALAEFARQACSVDGERRAHAWALSMRMQRAPHARTFAE